MSNPTVPATAEGMSKVSRREVLRTLAAGSAAGALTGGMAIMATPSAADTMTPIERIAADLRARFDRDTSDLSDAESDAAHDEFMALLDRLIRMEPQTPRDVAIQWHADCLFNTSDNSDEFRERLTAMAGISQGAGPAAPSPTVSELAERHKAYLAAYSAAPINSQSDEETFFATADTKAGDILDITPPPITSRADLIAALHYIADDTDFAQEAHVRLLRSALAYLEGRA